MSIRDTIAVNRSFVIGMVHCLPLIGTPGFKENCQQILDQAVSDAVTLEKAGVDAIIVENMGDGPFGAKLHPEQVIGLSAATALVKNAVKIPVGVDAAFNDCRTALAIAKMCGCGFIRVPVFVDTVVFYNGIINPCSHDCMYYRKQINAEEVMVLADIQVKHTKMVFPDIPMEQSAKDAESCGADGIIVTGSAIGVETPLEAISRVKKTVKIPVIAGSGVTSANIQQQMEIADGIIVGSSLKEGGKLENPISYELTRELLGGLN